MGLAAFMLDCGKNPSAEASMHMQGTRPSPCHMHSSVHATLYPETPNPLPYPCMPPSILKPQSRSLISACTAVQVETGEPICWLSSANLMEVAPTYHIARFLPSILESKAPFTFALQVCQALQPPRHMLAPVYVHN